MKVGDRVRIAGNVMYGRVLAITEQWFVVVNDERRYLQENPGEKHRQYAVKVDSIVDIRPAKHPMKNIYLAQMNWSGALEPVCGGTNKRRVMREALRLLKAEHGTGSVSRGAAMCSLPITQSDIEIVTVPIV